MHTHTSFGFAVLFPGRGGGMWAMSNSQVNNWPIILKLKGTAVHALL